MKRFGMERARGWAIGMCAAMVLPVTPAFGQTPAGIIRDFSGEVYLSKPGGSSKTKLDARAKGRLLYPGEVLECGRDGTAKVHVNKRFAGTGEKYRECGPGRPQIRLELAATEHRPQAPALSGEEVLQGYKIAGRDKGSDSLIYSPADGAAVTAAGFTVRWRTRPLPPAFAVILRDEAGRELAREAGADPGAGQLDSRALGEAVAKYRDSGGGERRARVVFRSESGAENGVTFTVLTKEQEQSLRQALAKQGTPEGFWGHVERAAIYDSFRMYGSVAAEYDAALALAPESLDLLEAAMAVHSKTGDLRRARELREKLQALQEADAPGGRP